MYTEIDEALSAQGASPLIQKVIDPVVQEYMRRLSPLIGAVPTRPWSSTQYFWNARLTVAPGGNVMDGSARPLGTSTYQQNNYTMKLFQTVGGVTGYAQAVTSDLIGSLLAKEEQGAMRGQIWDVEVGMVAGNSAATANNAYPGIDGLDTLVSATTGGYYNTMNYASSPYASLPFGGPSGSIGGIPVLDDLINLITLNAQEQVEMREGRWAFLMSPKANTDVARSLTNQQRYVDKVELPNSGLVVQSYRNIPIIVSGFLSSSASAGFFGGITSGTISLSTATTGGTLTNATYYYKVAAVVARAGELVASAEASQATTGSTSTVTISLPNLVGAGPDSGSPLFYKVFRSTTTGTETLLGYVDAVVSLQSDNITPNYATSIIDTGTVLIPHYSGGNPTTPDTAYNNQNSGIVPLAGGQENIYLIPLDDDYILRPRIREMYPISLYPTTTAPDILPFAMVTDTVLAIRGARYVVRAHNVTVP